MSTKPNMTVSTAIRPGTSWADQQDSPSWTSQAPPKFAEKMEEIELDEVEYDRNDERKDIPLFIGGLDFTWAERDIEDFFSRRHVKVSRVRVVKTQGRPSGRAFAVVADSTGLRAAEKLSGTELKGRPIIVREDKGPKPRDDRPPRRDFPVRDTRIGGRWKEENVPQRKSDSSGWQAVKGGKVVEAPRERRSYKKEEAPAQVAPVEPVATEEPKERKKLELKPRTKPLEEDNSARSSAIFGAAKPRDELAHKKDEEEEEVSSKPVSKKESPIPVPAPVVEATVAVSEPVKPAPKKKTTKNRFAVVSSSESESD
jgi:RNA recognition motif-containing protein